MPSILALRKQELKASLVFQARSRATRAIGRNSVLKNKKNKKIVFASYNSLNENTGSDTLKRCGFVGESESL